MARAAAALLLLAARQPRLAPGAVALVLPEAAQLARSLLGFCVSLQQQQALGDSKRQNISRAAIGRTEQACQAALTQAAMQD